jgi:hypothetical protein
MNQTNAQLAYDIRENQRQYIYSALKRRKWDELELLRRRALANEWSQGYQRTPIYDKNWKRRDPILNALKKDQEYLQQQRLSYPRRYGGSLSTAHTIQPKFVLVSTLF